MSQEQEANAEKPMRDITSPTLIYAKGVLFLLTGLLASALLILEQPTLKVACLLAIAVWCFPRCYYFAFYVIEHYVDPSYRFAGLWSFACYLARRRPATETPGGAASDATAPDGHDHHAK